MFAAVAALGMASAFAIESEVVGYAGNNVVGGTGMIFTPQFQNLSKTTVDLQDIIPQGKESFDSVQAQKLDKLGYTKDGITYAWVDYASTGNGWVDVGTLDDAAGVTLEPGEALWLINNATDKNVVQTSGKVFANEVTHILCKGGTWIGNPYPTQVRLGDLLPSGLEVYDNVQIQKIDGLGFTKDDITYAWVNYADTETGDGWVDIGSLDDANNVPIEPGEGVLVIGTKDPHETDKNLRQYITIFPPEGI